MDEFVGVRYHAESGERLLLVTFGKGVLGESQLPESLRAPDGMSWRLALSSNAEAFGGVAGSAAAIWTIEGPAAAWLQIERLIPDVP
jgi:hypothetical protein